MDDDGKMSAEDARRFGVLPNAGSKDDQTHLERRLEDLEQRVGDGESPIDMLKRLARPIPRPFSTGEEPSDE